MVGGIEYQYMAAFRCSHCSSLSLARWSGDPTDVANNDIQDWIPLDVGDYDYEDVPELIANMANEVHRCLAANAPRATAILGRAVIEASAKHFDINEGKVHEKIEALYARGLIREHLKEAAHAIRIFANDSAHGDLVEPPEHEDLELAVELMDEVLDELFQAPAKVIRLRDAAAARTRASKGVAKDPG